MKKTELLEEVEDEIADNNIPGFLFLGKSSAKPTLRLALKVIRAVAR